MGTAELPIVGVLACRKVRANGSAYARVNDSVTRQLNQRAGVAVVLIPPADPSGARSTLQALDGLLLPGSGSFVHPARYSETTPPKPEREYDLARDEMALALLSGARELPDLPVLASCRGMQELAVASGGQLFDIPDENRLHRTVASPGVDRWAFAHPLRIRPGGFLDSLGLHASQASKPLMVNSQHTQVVDALPSSVRIEAMAPDGLIESFSVDWPQRWLLAIQWHCEQRTEESVLDQKILQAFGERCRRRKQRRTQC